MALPYGWSERFAIEFVVQQCGQLNDVISSLSERLADLEAEIARLDVQKANRAGRKPKETVSQTH